MGAFLETLAAILRAGFRPPARWLGVAGLLVVGAVLMVPSLAAFAAVWHIPAVISLAAWLGMAITQVEPEVYRRLRYRLAGHDPYLLRALERRDALAAEMEHLTISSVRVDVAAMLRAIDRELLPDLPQRVRRHRALVQALAQMERGRGPLVGASPERITALKQLAAEQRKALDGLITRLSDMTANLMGLNQEADQAQITEQTREWADGLGAYWQATAEIFRPTDFATAGDRGSRPAPEDGKGRRGAR